MIPIKDDLHLHRTLKYAADMKKLEEDGRIIILPCKWGEEIYTITSKCLLVTDEECDSVDDCDSCPYDKENVVRARTFTTELFNAMYLTKSPNYILGKNVFTNREEAYEALKKI